MASGRTASWWESVTTSRSARRQMVRARWQWAADRLPPGSMKSFSGGRSALNPSSCDFEAFDIGVGNRGVAGNAQFAAQIEHLVLHRDQHLAHRIGNLASQDQADRRVGLVHRAVGGDARRVLGNPRAVAQAGAAVIAGAGVDLRKPVAHRSRALRLFAGPVRGCAGEARQTFRTSGSSRTAFRAVCSGRRECRPRKRRPGPRRSPGRWASRARRRSW